MAQRRVPQSVSTPLSREVKRDSYGASQFLTTPPASPTDLFSGGISAVYTPAGPSRAISNGSTGSVTLSFTSSEWVGMVGIRVFQSGYITQLSVDGSPVSTLPNYRHSGFPALSKSFDIQRYGATIDIGLTWATRTQGNINAGLALPRTFIDSNNSVLWPENLRGQSVGSGL